MTPPIKVIDRATATPEWAYKAAEEIMHAEPVPYPEQAGEGIEEWADIIARHAVIDRFVQRGDAALRWVMLLTSCAVIALVGAAFIAVKLTS